MIGKTLRCPFEAIAIINLPTNLESQVTHRYTANAFKLHRLPTPRPGQVLGLVGTNGIGKSTALKILAGKQKPNLGRYDVSGVKLTKDEINFYLAGPSRLARNFTLLPWVRAAKLFHKGPRGQLEGTYQATIC
jgi:translation initiation factor RLI1